MAHKIKVLVVSIGTILALASSASHTEIALLKQDSQADDPLGRLSFTVGGSIRPQFNMMSGDGDKGSYKRNGLDGGTRFCFAAGHYLFDDISWISYYELGVNIPALFGWDNHYTEGVNNTTRCMLYTGLESDAWDTLTHGQQNSIHYDAVGVKTDIWDCDMIGQAPGDGINGDYDGSYRLRNTLKYKKTVGDVDLHDPYLFEDSEYLPGDGLRYKCKGGGSIGTDYHIMKGLTWGTAWNYTRTETYDPSSADNKACNQNIVGTALSWTPGNWTFSFGDGWYQSFLTTRKTDAHNYSAGDAWGTEYSVGCKLLINQYAVKSIQPYFMGDRLQYVNDHNYQRINNGLGISFQLDYSFRVDYEHVFTPSTDNLGDTDLVRPRHDF